MLNYILNLRKYKFLFEELVKRDFKKKYKRTVLGVFWSILSPLLMLLVLKLVFTNFFGRDLPHYTIYLFAGWIVFHYFTDSTNSGMQALMGNSNIITKVNVPKYLFVFSKNASSLINFLIILVIFFIFAAFDGIKFTWKFSLLLYPIFCIVLFNIGIGLVLSTLYVFFKDTQYLYAVVTQVIMYVSAIFYPVEKFEPSIQILFNLNPVFVYISYIRQIVIYNTIPSVALHLLCLLYASIFAGIGCWCYKKYNYKFLYYM